MSSWYKLLVWVNKANFIMWVPNTWLWALTVNLKQKDILVYYNLNKSKKIKKYKKLI